MDVRPLITPLLEAGASVAEVEPDRLLVVGLGIEEVRRLAADRGIALSESTVL